MVIKFRIGGSLRYLSHAETLRLFQRACVRAGINLQYSQGFNPHPRLSLPLPRPVGVDSDDELLTVKMNRRSLLVACRSRHESRDTSDEARIRDALSKQLPDGCEIISVKFADSHSSFQPRSATYILPVRQEYLDRQLTDRIRDVLDRDTLVIRRSRGDKDARIKNIDVRGFLSSIEVDRADIIVECGLSAAGSIRLREVLELLELDETKLDSPIRRTNVQWRDV